MNNEYLERMNTIMKENGSNAKKTTEKLGISSASFTDWKKGKGRPIFETVIRFAELYNTSIDYIAWGSLSEKSDDSNSSPAATQPSAIDPELLALISKLSPEKQIELRGYVKRTLEEITPAAEVS